MKKILITAVAAVWLGGLGASSAQADWTDDFESYTHGAALGAPWESVANFGAYVGLGEGGSKGTQGPGANWEFGRAYRPTQGIVTLTAQLYLESAINYQGSQINLTTDAVGMSNGSAGGGDMLRISLEGTDTSNTAQIAFLSIDGTPGQGDWLADTRVYSGSSNGDFHLSADTWYDVRIELNGLDATASYKESTSPTWITIGTLAAYSEFVPNYVALSAVRRGYADNVTVVSPPPTSVDFDTITVADTAAMQFMSTSGHVYQLDFTTDLVAPTNWTSSGASTVGNGGTMLLFDPTGTDTSKIYRIAITP